MTEVLVSAFLLLGSAFSLIAAIGVARFPDFYCRMHAAAKAGAFGGTLLLLAAGFALGSAKAWFLCGLVVVFFYLTTPAASHLLARAAWRRGAARVAATRIENEPKA